ncbi:MAG: NYN domain-containing protein [Gammaproteobacteria bacterium]|nr:NYN domain-containing protein [Gammaproteobacteria bacterium]
MTVASTKARAIIFIDGNNFYHGMKKEGLSSIELDYAQFSRKLVINREWLETRYYIGRVKQEGDTTRYQKQQKFLHQLKTFDKVNYFLGRVERREMKGASKKLNKWLNALPNRPDVSISPKIVEELRRVASIDSVTWVEKAVDVMIATDMVSMAHENKYDIAYLLSADGDFTHAIKKVRDAGCKILVASPVPGYQISKAADSFIRLDRKFFHGCWL